MKASRYAHYVNRTVVAIAVGALFGTASLYLDRDNQSILATLNVVGNPISQAYSASLVSPIAAASFETTPVMPSSGSAGKTMQSQINLPTTGAASVQSSSAAPAKPSATDGRDNAATQSDRATSDLNSANADYHFIILINRLEALQNSVDQANAEIALLKATTIESSVKADNHSAEAARTLDQIKQFASKVEDLSKLSSIVNKIQQAQQKAAVAQPKPPAPSTSSARPTPPSAANTTSAKEFKIISASSDYLVITQNGNTKKVEAGSELPNGATFRSFDGKQIVTSAGSYLVQ